MAYINRTFPLILEPHPENYKGYPFITLLEYGDENILTIIDNHNKNNINAFVLDYCKLEGIDEDFILKIVKHWHDNNFQYPVSIEFSKHGVQTHKIFKSFNINYVKRIIGPLPKYNMDITKKIKRKKKKICLNVNYKTSNIWKSDQTISADLFKPATYTDI